MDDRNWSIWNCCFGSRWGVVNTQVSIQSNVYNETPGSSAINLESSHAVIPPLVLDGSSNIDSGVHSTDRQTDSR